jgi:uncharacterized protein with GYD domain
MATFLISGSWTDQGIRNIKEAPKRLQGARELAKKLGIDSKIYLTSGGSDLFVIAETANPESIPRFNLAIAAEERRRKRQRIRRRQVSVMAAVNGNVFV